MGGFGTAEHYAAKSKQEYERTAVAIREAGSMNFRRAE